MLWSHNQRLTTRHPQTRTRRGTEGNMLMQNRTIFLRYKKGQMKEKSQKMTIKGEEIAKTLSFLGLLFHHLTPFFDQKCHFGGLIKKGGKKGSYDGKKGANEKIRSLFCRHSLFAAANFWRRGAKAKQILDTIVINTLVSISSDRYLFVQEADFQGHQIHVASLALNQRQALVRSVSNQR